MCSHGEVKRLRTQPAQGRSGAQAAELHITTD